MVDYNKCITVEEAERILVALRRYYPGVFDRTRVAYGDSFMYVNTLDKIYIEENFCSLDESQLWYILDHVSKTYGIKLEHNYRTASLQAFLHECGHCIDLKMRKAQGRYEMYVEEEMIEREVFDTKKYAYYNMRIECDELREEAHFNPDLSMEEREEMMNEADEIEEEMKEVEAMLDREYRMINTEVAADKFSADLLRGMFRAMI